MNLVGFSILNHPFWGTPNFGNTHIYKQKTFFPHRNPPNSGLFYPACLLQVTPISSSVRQHQRVSDPRLRHPTHDEHGRVHGASRILHAARTYVALPPATNSNSCAMGFNCVKKNEIKIQKRIFRNLKNGNPSFKTSV